LKGKSLRITVIAPLLASLLAAAVFGSPVFAAQSPRQKYFTGIYGAVLLRLLSKGRDENEE
jgi:hypothetical protein